MAFLAFSSPRCRRVRIELGSEVGEAGSLMIVTRDLGTSIGIAMAASLLSWQLRVLTGGSSTLNASEADLTSAIRTVVIVLAVLALLAAVLSWVRPAGRTAKSLIGSD